ncbi:hypothetical protein Tco_0768686, partial [Tanacetum coccineum]
YTKPKRKRDDLWFKEKVLLVQAQAHGQILNKEELAFLADPDIPEGQSTQTVITHNASYQEVEVVVVMVKVDLRDFQEEGHPRCSQAKGLKVEERLVQLRMEVRFEVLIEKKKMYYLGLRRFDLWMEFLMVHLEELGLRK